MSDTVTLVAGVLLTSAGLLALLPYVLKRGWQQHSGSLAVDSGYASVMVAVEAFAGDAKPRESVPAEDLEELLAQLFSLRLSVSDANAELEEAHEALREEMDGNLPSGAAEEVA